jgi:muramoyltetrapeptide carboxypeptidase
MGPPDFASEPLLPAALRPGARLAVVSPASTPRPDLVERGMRALRENGYEPVLFEHALDRGPLYFAGTAAERAADLHRAFADDAIDGILCTRGGFGSVYLLPLLDVALIRANPKPFVGYSDQTSVQGWLWRATGLITFHGPMVAADFARANGVDDASWLHALTATQPWSMGSSEGLQVLRPGKASGRLLGGCTSLLVASLNTPFEAQTGDCVLFLEDIGTKPYQMDRMLVQLEGAGKLKGVRGIVFGEMRNCIQPGAPEELLTDSILFALKDFEGPIAIGLRSGHVDGANVTLPLGVQVELDLTQAANPQLHIVSPAVRG